MFHEVAYLYSNRGIKFEKLKIFTKLNCVCEKKSGFEGIIGNSNISKIFNTFKYFAATEI